MAISILTITAIILGLLSFIIPDFIIPAIILAGIIIITTNTLTYLLTLLLLALPYLRSYFVKPQKAVAAVSSTSSSSFINKDLFKKTVLKTNNNNSNTTSNTKWSSIWKWSKKANSSTNSSTTKAIINKKSTNNGDNENSWGIPTLRLRDHNGDIIPINSNTAVPIDTKYFKGNSTIVIVVNSHITITTKHY